MAKLPSLASELPSQPWSETDTTSPSQKNVYMFLKRANVCM